VGIVVRLIARHPHYLPLQAWSGRKRNDGGSKGCEWSRPTEMTPGVFFGCSFPSSYTWPKNGRAEKEERIMSEREESWMERALRERSWRVPEGHRRVRCAGLEDLFRQFADPNTSSYAARGLVQGIVLAAELELQGRADLRRDGEYARDHRQAIVAFLTSIGSESPNDDRAEPDLEVRRAARTTLAKHVAPIIACWSQPTGFNSENFGTLIHLVQFYEMAWVAAGKAAEKYGHVDELTGGYLKNVRECLGRVYRELRRHLGCECGCEGHGGHLAGALIRRLNQLLVDLHWWDVLSQVRAVSAIPVLYNAALEFVPESCGAALQFDWAGVEEHQVGGLFARRAFAEQHRDAIQHDLWAIQIVAGERNRPDDIGGRYGFRPLLLDLVATFVREMEIAHPGALSGDMPLPEDPTCLHHDQCVDEAVRRSRAERAAETERLRRDSEK